MAKAASSCQFCGKKLSISGKKNHEKWCTSNPANEPTGAPPEDSDDSEKTPTDYASTSIEELMDDITETEKELADLRQALSKRLDDRGLRFARKEE